VIQVNDSVEGGAYWKSPGVTILDEKHEVVKPHSVEYVTVRQLEVEVDDDHIENGKTSKYVVYQISYRGWKDALIPLDLDVFKRFLEIVDDHRNKLGQPDMPVAVHCMAGWGRTGVFIMIDAHRPLKMPYKKDLITKTWRRMLLQRELIQNPIQLAFSSGYLASQEKFQPEQASQIAAMTVQWFKLVGSVLLMDANPTLEAIVNVLKNDESGMQFKPQNWWAKAKELNPDMDEQELFLYLVRMPKKCLTWMMNKKIGLKTLVNAQAATGNSGTRNGLQLLYDDELVAVEKAIKEEARK